MKIPCNKCGLNKCAPNNADSICLDCRISGQQEQQHSTSVAMGSFTGLPAGPQNTTVAVPQLGRPPFATAGDQTAMAAAANHSLLAQQLLLHQQCYPQPESMMMGTQFGSWPSFPGPMMGYAMPQQPQLSGPAVNFMYNAMAAAQHQAASQGAQGPQHTLPTVSAAAQIPLPPSDRHGNDDVEQQGVNLSAVMAAAAQHQAASQGAQGPQHLPIAPAAAQVPLPPSDRHGNDDDVEQQGVNLSAVMAAAAQHQAASQGAQGPQHLPPASAAAQVPLPPSHRYGDDDDVEQQESEEETDEGTSTPAAQPGGVTPPATQARCSDVQGHPHLDTSGIPGLPAQPSAEVRPHQTDVRDMALQSRDPLPETPATASQLLRNRRAQVAEHGDDVMMMESVDGGPAASQQDAQPRRAADSPRAHPIDLSMVMSTASHEDFLSVLRLSIISMSRDRQPPAPELATPAASVSATPPPPQPAASGPSLLVTPDAAPEGPQQLPATSPPPLAQELLRDICEMAQAFADRHEMHPSTLPTMMQIPVAERVATASAVKQAEDLRQLRREIAEAETNQAQALQDQRAQMEAEMEAKMEALKEAHAQALQDQRDQMEALKEAHAGELQEQKALVEAEMEARQDEAGEVNEKLQAQKMRMEAEMEAAARRWKVHTDAQMAAAEKRWETKSQEHEAMVSMWHRNIEALFLELQGYVRRQDDLQDELTALRVQKDTAEAKVAAFQQLQERLFPAPSQAP